MANCTIYPIPLVEFLLDKSCMTYLCNFGQPMRQIAYVWYIEGTREKILVDAGVDADFLAKHGLPSARGIQTIESGLDKVGLSPEDIDLIIQTHLHLDHVALAFRYPRARVLVQKSELEFARIPHPLWAFLYPKETFEGLRFEVVDGDTRISEEISLILTPGHSPGAQSVVVKTDQGTAVIPGACTIRENYEPMVTPHGDILSPVIAPGIHTDVLKAYDSVLRIKELADIILPLNEPSLLEKQRVP